MSKTANRSQSVEDYLKTIYKLENETDGGVSTSDLAKDMNVSNASVTNMVKRRDEAGMSRITERV